MSTEAQQLSEALALSQQVGPKPSREENKQQDVVVILDAGAQYAKVIDRRIRELMVESEIKPLNTSIAELKKYRAIIISGGPQSVYGTAAPKYDPQLFELGIPILGICYGMQLINYVHKGKVAAGAIREEGISRITYNPASKLFRGIGSVALTTAAKSGPEAVTPSMEVLLTHGDSVQEVAPGFVTTATSSDGICAALENEAKHIYGVQFHPEVDLTKEGKHIFENFLELANVARNFTMSSRQQQAINEIRSIVGNNKVLCLVSGGVDSSVCAALLKEAIGADKIYALHVDSGFMRLNESSGVKTALEKIGMKLEVVDASETFFNATTEIDGHTSEQLKITVQPEVKRKIIGDTFMRVSNQAIARWGLNPSEVFLAQGTLRPDLIESASHLASASGNADVIKTHHNDTALVRALRAQGKVVEPLKDYHKDEVRQLGHELGLPDHLIWRQPFPGPGLAIRIICADTPYITQQDGDIINQLKTYTNDKIHATLLPCRTVGVQGDGRSYRSLVGLSSTTPPTPAIWTQLFDFAHQIPKKVHGVNRVIYVYGEPIHETHLTTITPTRLVPEAIQQLQHADDIVNQVLLKYNLMKSLSQVPVVLFPVSFGHEHHRSICIRTFITNDFMTGLPAIPGLQIPAEAVDEMVTRILTTVPNIARVCYDLTAKPPATTEWE